MASAAKPQPAPPCQPDCEAPAGERNRIMLQYLNMDESRFNEMLDKPPTEVWENTEKTFCVGMRFEVEE